MKKEKKEVYQSIDILSKEMAKQYFNDNINNIDKLSKEVELELLHAQLKKENKELGDNLKVLYESIGEENDNLDSDESNKESELSIKQIKSTKIKEFDKALNKPKNVSTFKKFNSGANNNINLNMENNESKKKTDNLKISSEKNGNPEPVKTFHKKITQTNIKLTSYSKPLKSDNSSIKTKLINISATNKKNSSESNSNIKSVNSLFDKKASELKSYSKTSSIKDMKIIKEKDSNIEKGSMNYSKKAVINEESKKNEINQSIRESKASKKSQQNNNIINKKSSSSSDTNSVNTIIINNESDSSNKSEKNKNDENNKNTISRKNTKKNESNKSINKFESSNNDSSSDRKSSNISNNINNKKNKENDNSKNNDLSDSSNLIKELSKEDINIPKPKQEEIKQSKIEEESKNVENSSFISSEKSPINLQKVSLKNFVVYRKKKRTPKQFYEHQIFLMHRQEKINNSKKEKNLAKEYENIKEFPSITPYSEEIINNKGNYIPIYERTIELQNQKKVQIMLNERKKKKEIDDMMEKYSNNSFYVDKNEIEQFYSTQIKWNDNIKKRNSDLLRKKEQEKKNEENKILSYTIEINQKSKKLAENKIRNCITSYNSFLSRNKNKKNSRANTFERLYEHSKIHENKINRLTKAYYAPLFKPNINKSYRFNISSYKLNNPKRQPQNTNITNKKNSNFTAYLKDYQKKIKFNKISKNVSNISKKLKKKQSYSMTFEDINLPKKKQKKSRNKNNLIKRAKFSKSSKGLHNIPNTNSYGITSTSTKLYTSMKDIVPLPIKLGEIKEMDSAIAESTGRNNNAQENKNNIGNKSKIIEEGSMNYNKDFNSSNDSNLGKYKNNSPSNKKSSAFKNANYFNNNEIKEEEKEDENTKANISNNKSKFSNSKKESLKNANSKDSPTPKLSSKNNLDQNYSKEYIKASTKTKMSKKKISQFLQNNTQSFNDILSPAIRKESNKLNLLISNEHNDNLLILENSLLNDSGSFGNYQPSNLLENLTKELKEKEQLIEKVNKIKKAEKIEKNKEEPLTRKKNKYKFDAYNYEDEDSKDKESLSIEEISPLNEGEENALIKKFKMIEDMEGKNKTNIINKNTNKYGKDNKDKSNNNNLYMLNFMENAPNAVKNPFILTDNKGIFFEFFKKK